MTSTLICLVVVYVSLLTSTGNAVGPTGDEPPCPLGWMYAEQEQFCQKEIFFSGPVWTQARQFCERLNATFALITVNPEDKRKTPVCELPSSAFSSSRDDAPAAAPSHSDPEKPEASDEDSQHGGVGNSLPVGNGTDTQTECADTLSTWKCRSLKTLQACKAGRRLDYVKKNCAKTCGFC